MAQARYRFLRQHQQVMIEQVIWLQNVGGHELYALEIAAGQLEIAIFAVCDEQRGLFPV